MTKEGLRLSRIGLCGYLHGFPARPLWCSSDSYSTTESSSILKTDDPTLVSLWFFCISHHSSLLHNSTWFLILPYILVPWLPSCFLHPRVLSSPAYVLCWWPFLFLFCLSSQLILFLLKVPHSSSSQWPFFSSSPPYFLLVHPLRPLSLLAHHIRHPSLILDADHLSPNVLLISDTWSTISPDIWHRHHLSFSYVRFISYLLKPPIWSRPARSVLLTTWSEGRIIDRITAFSPNYQY